MNEIFSHKIVAIIISYFPRIEVLRELINAIAPQVYEVVIVDNGSPENIGQQINGCD